MHHLSIYTWLVILQWNTWKMVATAPPPASSIISLPVHYMTPTPKNAACFRVSSLQFTIHLFRIKLDHLCPQKKVYGTKSMVPQTCQSLRKLPQNPRVKGPAPESALLDAIPGISAPSTSSEVEPQESTGEGFLSPEVWTVIGYVTFRYTL